jgi:hypothetical protein
MFHVYHKVKGDRAGPAEYKLLFSRPTREQAKEDAEAYNTRNGYKAGGLHVAVVLTRMVH